MWIQLSTGNDSLRAQQNSSRRNVSVRSFVRVTDEHGGNSIVPMFSAYKDKLPGFKKQNVVSVIPATEKFAANDAGQWFVNQHEVAPGTEILLEYRHRSRTEGSFGENIEYLMLIAEPTGALWRLQLDLPPHYLSAVPYVFFEGRFAMLEKDAMLSDKAVAAWKKHLGGDDDLDLSDYMDSNAAPEDQAWTYMQLEAAIQAKQKVETVATTDGGTKLRIKRARRITVR